MKVNHFAHLFLSLATFGLWVVPWISVAIGMLFRPWRCQHCGWHKPEPDQSLDRERRKSAAAPAAPLVQSVSAKV